MERKPDDPVHLLEQDLRALSDGPITLLQDQESKLKDVEGVLSSFSAFTIKRAIEEIQSHITFLDKHQGHANLVLTTVDYSKSQEFETVFVLGIDRVYGKRLYVSVSRAKQRLFLLGNSAAFTSHKALSEVPENLYTEYKRV